MNLIALNFGLAQRERLNMPRVGTKELEYYIESTHRPELIRKSHHQAEAFPIQFLLDNYAVIYVKRDLCAVMVSCWHYFLNNGSPEFPKCKTFDEFLAVDPSAWAFDDHYSVIKSKSMPERWRRHVESWSDVEGVTQLSFSDMINAPETAMLRIGIALGRSPLNPVQIPTRGDNCICFRKGIYEAWKEEVTIRQQRKIERLAA